MKALALPEGFSVEERRTKAMKLFKEGGYNCCQAVLLCFADVLEANGLAQKEVLAIIGSGLGGGMARLREVCGSFSGMAMLAGFISPADDPSIKAARTANYALVQEFAESFRNANGGSIVCRELLGLSPRLQIENPEPSDRTAEYYKKRPCEQIIGNAAAIVAERLLYIRDNN